MAKHSPPTNESTDDAGETLTSDAPVVAPAITVVAPAPAPPATITAPDGRCANDGCPGALSATLTKHGEVEWRNGGKWYSCAICGYGEAR